MHTGTYPITETTCDDVNCGCHAATIRDASSNPADADFMLRFDGRFVSKIFGDAPYSRDDSRFGFYASAEWLRRTGGLSPREFAAKMSREGWLFPLWLRRLLGL